MVKVVVRPGEPLEKALRRFKRNCNNAGILRETKARSVYEKPTNLRRKRKHERIKNIRKAQFAREL